VDVANDILMWKGEISNCAFVGRWPGGARFFMILTGIGVDGLSESDGARVGERRYERSRKMYQMRQQSITVRNTVASWPSGSRSQYERGVSLTSVVKNMERCAIMSAMMTSIGSESR
jgi:hypothetical protein